MHQYEIKFWLPRPRRQVYDYLSDVRNLDLMTPSWLCFHVMPPGPAAIRLGTCIDYHLRWRRVPLRWRSEITVWQPMEVFTYEQRIGPYRTWIHEHLFADRDGGTEVIDRVTYSMWCDRLVGRKVAGDVEEIFDHRLRFLYRHFPATATTLPPSVQVPSA